jgi:ABC-type amino acid transport system permease subunit
MTVALLALAFLCGVPIGIILGIVLLWKMNVPERDDDIDYSGGA